MTTPTICIHCGQVIPEDHLQRSLTFQDIADAVCKVTEVPFQSIIDRSFDYTEVNIARHLIVHVCYFYTTMSVKLIATNIRYKNHSSTMYGVHRIEQDRRVIFDVRLFLNNILIELTEQGFKMHNHGYRTNTRPDRGERPWKLKHKSKIA